MKAQTLSIPPEQLGKQNEQEKEQELKYGKKGC